MQNKGQYIRLQEVLKQYLEEDPKRTIASFEKEFGLANAFFSSAEKQGKPIEEKVIYNRTFANLHRAQPLLNIDWIKTGEGKMWLKETPIKEKDKFKADLRQYGSPYYNIDFVSGVDFDNSIAVPISYIYMEPYNGSCYRWCNFAGESMYPRIVSGAKICLRLIEEGVEGVVFGNIYALVLKGNKKTLRWVVNCDDDAKIRLIPENKDIKFGNNQDVFKSDVISVYKVEVVENPI